MEFKVIVYILLGIGYFIYSADKKVDEAQVKAPKPKRPAQPVTPKPKSWLDETIEKMQQEAEKAKQQTVLTKPKPQPRKNIIVHEVATSPAFEEGTDAEKKYQRELTSEEILHNERMRAAQVVVMEEASEQQPVAINPREAFIGSVIFERKF